MNVAEARNFVVKPSFFSFFSAKSSRWDTADHFSSASNPKMAKMTKLGICAQSSGVKGRSKERLAIFVSMEKSTWDNGHTESIISLDVNNDGIVVSGGEDGLRIWTPEGEPQTFLKHPCDVTSVCFCCQYPERLFASVGQQPLMYDLRNPQKPVHEFQPSAEEINQIALHYKGKFMAACDDTGVVKVFDIHAKKPFKTLRGKHESICASVQFRPCRPWELVTGGMDYRVVYWDFSSGRSFQVANTQELGGGDELGAYFVNPPFVHSVHMSADGRKFACGLGELCFSCSDIIGTSVKTVPPPSSQTKRATTPQLVPPGR